MKKLLFLMCSIGTISTMASMGECMQAYVAAGARASFAKIQCANYEGNTGCMQAFVMGGSTAEFAKNQCKNYGGDGACMQAFVADGTTAVFAKTQCK